MELLGLVVVVTLAAIVFLLILIWGSIRDKAQLFDRLSAIEEELRGVRDETKHVAFSTRPSHARTGSIDDTLYNKVERVSDELIALRKEVSRLR